MDDHSAQEARVHQVIYGRPRRNSVITGVVSAVLVAPFFLLRGRVTTAERIVPVVVIGLVMGLWCYWLIDQALRRARRSDGQG